MMISKFCAFISAALVPTLALGYAGSAAMWAAIDGSQSQIIDHSEGERCLIAKRTDFASYHVRGDEDRDATHEKRLCASDFYMSQDGDGHKASALCPKITSTNPAIEIYGVSAALSKAAQETDQNCRRPNRAAKKIGKIKASHTCSIAQSIVGYYHMSRMLGDILNIPVAVYRTMDKVKHTTLVEQGTRLTRSSTDIGNAWRTFENAYSKITAPDGTIFGAFVRNISADYRYEEQDVSPSRMPGLALVKDRRAARQIVGTAFDEHNVQELQVMEDVSNMMLIDYIMSQADRFSGYNIKAKDYYVYRDANGMRQEVSVDDVNDGDATHPGAEAVEIAKMTLVDNDCGVGVGDRANRVMQQAILPAMRHMSPSTYSALKKVVSFLESDAGKSYFQKTLFFNDVHFERTKTNSRKALNILKQNCEAQRLKLDLDFDQHFAGASPTTGC